MTQMIISESVAQEVCWLQSESLVQQLVKKAVYLLFIGLDLSDDLFILFKLFIDKMVYEL